MWLVYSGMNMMAREQWIYSMNLVQRIHSLALVLRVDRVQWIHM